MLRLIRRFSPSSPLFTMTRTAPRSRFQAAVWTCLWLALTLTGTAWAAKPAEEAEAAARALAKDQEKNGYVFRADVWSGDLPKGLGKAVRMQLFKGNDYCIGVAVPRKSGIRITGAVLDFQGKPVGEIQPVLDGWGFLLFFKPAKTGTYVVTVHQEESGSQADTACALIIGYK
jgi:hypothetical protein